MSQPLYPVLIEARSTWSRQYQVDWSALSELNESPAQTLSNSAVSVSPSGPTLGSSSISNSLQLFTIDMSAGNTDTVYTLTCTVTTSGGSVIDREGKIIARG